MSDENNNVERVDFKKKEGIEQASEKVLASAKAANANVQFVDDALDIEAKLPEIREGEEFVDDMAEAEVDMFRQMAGLGTQIKKDLDIYIAQVETNLKALFNDDPEKISAYLIRKAVTVNVDQHLVNRLCRNKELYDLLRRTMFWRIQERTQTFHTILNIRKGFKIVRTEPVHIMQVDDAVNRLKKMQALADLEKSNHPMKDYIRQMIEQMW